MRRPHSQLVAIDYHIVDAFLVGHRVPLNRYERREVVRRLTITGESATRIGDRLGVSARSVQRLRQRVRTEGVMPSASPRDVPWWVPRA